MKHPHTKAENTILTRRAPRWAWDVIEETLRLDAKSNAFDRDLRADITRAINAIDDLPGALIARAIHIAATQEYFTKEGVKTLRGIARAVTKGETI